MSEDQVALDLETESGQAAEREEEKEKVTYERKQRRKDKPTRKPFPEHLRREESIIEPAGDLTGCEKIGEEVTEYLE